MSEVPADMQRAATEWQADGFAEASRTEKRVQALQDAQAPQAAQAAPVDAQAAQLQAVADSALPMLLGLVWTIADRAIVGFLGPHCSATDEERAQLVALSVPVVHKYLPKDLTGFVSTPEGALLLGAAAIYGLKAAAGAPTPPDAAPPAPRETPAAPSSPAPEATA